MADMQPLTETALAREALKRLCSERGVLHRALKVLELVGSSGMGLGEVLQDYAHQTAGELHAILLAGANVENDTVQKGDAQALAAMHFVLKSVKAVLDMTPAAMQRNKAEALGEKEKFTRVDICRVAHDFLHSPDVARLLAAEDSGSVFAALLVGTDDSVFAVPSRDRMLATASN